MAYKFRKGAAGLSGSMTTDDIAYFYDTDTKLDWDNDYISLQTGGNNVLTVSGSTVGVLDTAPDGYALSVSGNVGFAEYIYHQGDDDTYIRFEADSINIYAGGRQMIKMVEGATDKITINNGGQDLDLQIKGENEANLIRTIAADDSVGIVANAPKITLDVHYTGSGDPINLGNDTGGGEVVFFGTSSAAMVAGGIYYLNTDGGWQSADSATTGSGHKQLLGVAVGTKAEDDGVLIRGYFDVNTFYSGSFIKGGPMYIQSSSASRAATAGGYLSGAAPTAGDSYVRVVGYGTDTANVIYFNPDSTYVEIA